MPVPIKLINKLQCCEQNRLFEKYYDWTSSIEVNHDIDDNLIVGFEFQTFNDQIITLFIYPNGSLAIYDKTKSISLSYLGDIQEKDLDKIIKLRNFK